jgi:hypothetical protein
MQHVQRNNLLQSPIYFRGKSCLTARELDLCLGSRKRKKATEIKLQIQGLTVT